MGETYGNVFPIRRERTWLHNGRLIVLDNSIGQLKDPFDIRNDTFSIDFPAMPDQIELARKATYKVSANMVLPDGIHQYMSTDPMKIPFSFKIHHGDTDYCTEGPLTLLKVAARLHSLVTPLGNSSQGIQVSNDGSLDADGNAQAGAPPSGKEAVVNKTSGQASVAQGQNTTSATYLQEDTQKTDPPVVVRLELINSRLDSPGIICTGYVEDVRAVLFGPWLRGPGNAANLPTAAEYSFTFVHRPGHGNYFSKRKGAAAVSVQAQAYAQFIRERLYNTRDLTSSAQYLGWVVPQI